MISYVECGRRPSRKEWAKEAADTKKLLKAWDKLIIRDSLLDRVFKTYLYVVPSTVHPAVLKGVHDEAGHQGHQGTAQKYFWRIQQTNQWMCLWS